MSDDATGRLASPAAPALAEIVAGLRPIGDLRRFAIHDLTPEEEDEFFAILKTT